MRPLALFVALLVLPLGGCTLTFPLGASLAARPRPGVTADAATLRPGDPVVLVSTRGQRQAGRWIGVVEDRGRGPSVALRVDGFERRFEVERVRSVHRQDRRSSWVGPAFVAGLALDATIVYRVLTTCCNYAADGY